ncbi:hypothetical protein SCUCBS95973_003229 [Sporothrix curviconia]|uniref:BZIP domain-containing protein n=1 Tax=Sporothrix curviconia TaxID=1260050 RepID=A0ABP0BDI4_9PEZI
MAPESEAGPMGSNTPLSTMAVAATALAASSDDRPVLPSASSRNFGVHNILNPSEAQQPMARSPSMAPGTSLSRGNSSLDSGESRPLPRTRPSSASSPRFASASSVTANHLGRPPPGHAPQQYGFGVGSVGSSGSITSRPHGFSGFAAADSSYGLGYAQPNPAADSSQPLNTTTTTQSPGMGFVPLSVAVGSDQESSPQPGYAHTASATSFGPPPRRILTPKSPRRSSLGRPLPGTSAPGSQHPLFSRRADTPPQQQQQQQQQQPRFSFPPGKRRKGEYAGNTPPSRIVSASSANAGSGEGSWGSQGAVGGTGGGRSLSMSEGQQFITITPSFGEEIHVPVDVHQASKQADEKRLRNAGASARFRARKKEKDREAQLGIQRLESMNRDIQKRAQELEMQRDFYRNERNRLRHIMSQSPSMREYVESGPPSPVSSFSSLPFVSENSGAQQSQPQQQQPQPQSQQTQQAQLMHPPAPEASSSSMERPAQRRRTDSGPNIEYYTPSYTTAAAPPPILPSTLPSSLPSPLPPPLPPAGPASRFPSMSPSPLSGSPNIPRLPPLRLDTPGSNPGSVGVGGGMATGPPTPEPGHGVSSLPVPVPMPHYPLGSTAPSAYNRSYDTAGWVADAPPPHPQHAPSDPKYQR